MATAGELGLVVGDRPYVQKCAFQRTSGCSVGLGSVDGRFKVEVLEVYSSGPDALSIILLEDELETVDGSDVLKHKKGFVYSHISHRYNGFSL